MIAGKELRDIKDRKELDSKERIITTWNALYVAMK